MAGSPNGIGQQSRLGTLLDPICDRLFVVPVLATLVLVHGLPLWQLALLISRDLANSAGALAVLLLRPALVRELRPRRSGKLVTSLQFWSVVHIVLRLPLFELSLAAVTLATGSSRSPNQFAPAAQIWLHAVILPILPCSEFL